MATTVIARRPPRLGLKAVYLPNFTLTLLRTPKLPSTFASFIVPLNLNKLDLRDYLWNCYGVRVKGVRSYIQQQKIRQDKAGAKRPSPRRWMRPRSIKKMMVELESPFVWPEEPESLDKWDKEIHDAAKKDQDEFQASMRPDSKEKPTKERRSIAQQAQALLKGKQKWKDTPTESSWEDVGDAVEVESDITIPKE